MIRLGRISYVNMAPVFHRLNAEVEEVTGVPTELNAMLLDGQLDVAPISSIEYARHASALPRERLDGHPHREELEALTHAVVDRDR